MAWRIVDGQLVCQRGHVIACDGDMVFTQGRRKCRACHRSRNSRSARSITARRQLARVPRECLGCGRPVPVRRQKFCSQPCCARESARVANDRIRAELASAAFEPVYRWLVYERDNWTCQLCGLAVLWFLDWPHDWCPVLDHRMPLALGGDHSYANTQLAHNTCNAWKSFLGPAEFEQRLTEIGIGEWESVVTGAAA